jgi:hypothetical protein
MTNRNWYTEDLLAVIARVPNAKIVKVFGSLRGSGYLTIDSKGTLYRVRMSLGEWTPSLSAECRGDLSAFVKPRSASRAA